MSCIDLNDYEKVTVGRKDYLVHMNGTEFEIYKHKLTKEEIRVKRGSNILLPETPIATNKKTQKSIIIPLISLWSSKEPH